MSTRKELQGCFDADSLSAKLADFGERLKLLNREAVDLTLLVFCAAHRIREQERTIETQHSEIAALNRKLSAKR